MRRVHSIVEKAILATMSKGLQERKPHQLQAWVAISCRAHKFSEWNKYIHVHEMKRYAHSHAGILPLTLDICNQPVVCFPSKGIT